MWVVIVSIGFRETRARSSISGFELPEREGFMVSRTDALRTRPASSIAVCESLPAAMR